jgi:hypothetical protein
MKKKETSQICARYEILKKYFLFFYLTMEIIFAYIAPEPKNGMVTLALKAG